MIEWFLSSFFRSSSNSFSPFLLLFFLFLLPRPSLPPPPFPILFRFSLPPNGSRAHRWLARRPSGRGVTLVASCGENGPAARETSGIPSLEQVPRTRLVPIYRCKNVHLHALCKFHSFPFFSWRSAIFLEVSQSS